MAFVSCDNATATQPVTIPKQAVMLHRQKVLPEYPSRMRFFAGVYFRASDREASLVKGS